jgi:DNA-binding transcriptional regulator GbsR (MarR family)
MQGLVTARSKPAAHGAGAAAVARDVRLQLVEVGGHTSQDFGLGRLVGQLLVYLYLWDGDCSLDQIGEELGLSKAAVSITARRLESLGLIRRSWKPGDRRKYYRTVDNIGVALRQGLLGLVRSKLDAAGSELNAAYATLENSTPAAHNDKTLKFLVARVKRAKILRDRATKALNLPLLKLLIG